jgi:hypothetical protein
VISYYHHQGDPYASNKLGVIVLPMILTINNWISPLGPHLLKSVNVSKLVGVGLSLMCLSVLLASYMKTYLGFLLFYGVMMPVGRGIYFYSLYVICWEWFPNCKGFVTGLITGAIGLGCLVFSILSTYIVNPSNIAPYLPSPDA